MDSNPLLATALDAIGSKELSIEDRKRLLQMGIGKGVLPEDLEKKYLFSEEEESPVVQQKRDPIYNYHNIKVSFIGFKAPNPLPSDISWPREFVFRFHFFHEHHVT